MCHANLLQTVLLALASHATEDSLSSHHLPQEHVGLRAISAVMGESAVVDNETGRILWEGGSSSTLAASIAPKLQGILGIPHIKATFLTLFLGLAIAGALAQVARRIIDDSATRLFHRTILSLTRRLLLLPRLPRWLIAVTIVLYLIEAYGCSTRQYLSHPVHDTEAFMEMLRNEPPKVEWKVRSYHYEHSLASLLNDVWRRMSTTTTTTHDVDTPSNLHLRWKRVTHTARGHYQFASCKDRTIAGVWKRATPLLVRHQSPHRRHRTTPLIKLSLTKTLLLKDATARRDYVQQQRAFLTKEHTDDYVEFSTKIHVHGYQPRVLAAAQRPVWCTLPVFWIFTLLGLTVPYRRFLSSRCDEVRMRVIKETTSTEEAYVNGWFAPQKTDSNAATASLVPETLSFRSVMQMLYDNVVNA